MSETSGLPMAGSVRPGFLALAALLGGLVLGQFLFKYHLETGPVPLHYHVTDEHLQQPLRLLLPIVLYEVEGEGAYVRWSTTGLVPASLLDRWVTATGTIYLLASLLTAVSFVASWLAFRSLPFTLTFTLAMAFGTQFNYAWLETSCSIYYLFVAYAQVNLLCLYLLCARPGYRPWAVRVGFVVSLVLLALCWESWLDYFVFLALFSLGGTALALWRRSALPPLRFVAVVTFAVAVPYLAIRVAHGGNHHQPGSECQLLTTHPHVSLMVEDYFSNVVTYVYIALTNYAPPWLLTSQAYRALTDRELVAAHHDYYPANAHLVPGHYAYLWHFQAGMVFLAFAYATWRLLAAYAVRPSARGACWLAGCLLVWTGMSVHTLIMFRNYLSAPVFAYKIPVGILGATVLLGLLARAAWRHHGGSYRGGLLLAGLWAVVLVGALARPGWQGQQMEKVSLRLPPDPWDRLLPAKPVVLRPELTRFRTPANGQLLANYAPGNPNPGVRRAFSQHGGSVLTFAIDRPPEVGELAWYADGSFAYVPPWGYRGPVTFTVRAVNRGVASDPVPVAIEVVAPKLERAASPLTTYRMPANGQLLANYAADNPRQGLAHLYPAVARAGLEFVLDAPPHVGSLVWCPDGSFAYAPPPDFRGAVAFTAHAAEAADDPLTVLIHVE